MLRLLSSIASLPCWDVVTLWGETALGIAVAGAVVLAFVVGGVLGRYGRPLLLLDQHLALLAAVLGFESTQPLAGLAQFCVEVV